MTDRPNIVTRFAPSPTGELHIGGARTALFNWAFARRHGGHFILRLEDTDRKRSSEASTRRIIADLKWLNINWDEGPDIQGQSLAEWLNPANPITQKGPNGPYFQSERLDRYQHHVKHLLAAGRAYKCFKSADELDAMRQAARAAGRTVAYDPTDSRNLTPERIAEYEAQGRPCVIRFAMPNEPVTVRDAVLGDVTVDAAQLEDFVIVKADGFPTYHFAVVVDDHEMNVTHVLRGQEHLNNTPKHVALQTALGFTPPTYAHIPLIFNPDGSKMSKRDKAKAARAAAKEWMREEAKSTGPEDLIADLTEKANDAIEGSQLDIERIAENEMKDFVDRKSDDGRIAVALSDPLCLNVALPEIDVHDFRESGYLPEALNNYLALLGWNPGGDIERFDMDFLKERFDLDRIGKSNAKFDRDKLAAFNQETIASLPFDRFKQLLWDMNPSEHGLWFGQADDSRFIAFAQAYQPRSKTLRDPAIIGAFFLEDDEQIDYDLTNKNVRKTLMKNDGEGLRMLQALYDTLNAVDPWSGAAAQTAIEQLAEAQDLKLGAVAQPLRVAVSGTTVTPPIDLTLEILGKQATLTRVTHCLNKTSQSSPTPNP